ncbi:MAG TPA: histidine kinase dimerization/phospho-acceptor domain-containing protein, partial [Fimbriimonadaceae bacterium]|nr:histidine kinase dimerization/phospho-acceptor domain-containing protein [Fimbriimonadaceae bacterium]
MSFDVEPSPPALADAETLKPVQIEHEPIMQMAERSNNLLAITGTSGDVQYINPAGLAFTGGGSLQEVLGSPIQSLFRDSFEIDAVMSEVAATDSWSGEVTLRNPQEDLVTHLVLNIFKVSRCEGGEPYAIAFLGLNLTERIKVEREIHNLNLALEERVEQRTAELRAANREMEAFTYAVAHDLRAPLRAIMATSMVLLEDYRDELSAPARRELERQRAAAFKMSELLDGLLMLSRLGRSVVGRVEFNLSKLAEEIAAELIGQQWKGDVQISVEPGLVVYADPRLMRLVLQNLMENACKFSKEGVR